MNTTRKIIFALSIALAALPIACSDSDDATSETGNIAVVAQNAGDFDTLLAALDIAGLSETIAEGGPFTVFAPSDSAFDKIPSDDLNALLAGSEQLAAILQYHVVAGELDAAAVVGSSTLTTISGEELQIDVQDGIVLIQGAQIVTTDIVADNGVIHVIDTVMIPEASADLGTIPAVAAEVGGFDTLLAALDAAGLADTLSGVGPFTVFAPTDDAFANLPSGTLEALLEDPDALSEVLLYHVALDELDATSVVGSSLIETAQGSFAAVDATGSSPSIGGAQIVVTDVEASNGIIHVIDTVITPPPSIAAIAADDPQLSTLVAALEAAGLVQTLSEAGTFTVFAPTNGAFEKLPEEDLNALLDDPEALSEILLFHVAGRQLPAAEVVTSATIDTLQGGSLTVQADAEVTVNGSIVIQTDIPAGNGIIHLIDTVMIP